MIGYTVTQVICYALGLLAFTTVVSAAGTADDQQHNLFAAFIAVPVGWLAFAVLVARELDESFANVYSTAVSIQNPLPHVDRRVLAVVVGAVATVGALVFNIGDVPELPLPARLAVRADVRGVRGALLRPRPGSPVGHERDRAVALEPARAVGGRLRRVPVDQPGLHRLVGDDVDPRAGLAALHAAVLDVAPR